MLFRSKDGANRMGVFLNPTSSISLVTTKNATSVTVAGTGTIYYQPITYKIRVVAIGKAITVYRDGVVSLNHTMSDADFDLF